MKKNLPAFTLLSLLSGTVYANIPPAFSCLTQNVTPIHTIQGETKTSTYVGKTVYVEGVISAITTLPHKGFFLQEEGIQLNGTQKASLGIFARSSDTQKLTIGQSVCVQADVIEDYGFTSLINIKFDDRARIIKNLIVTDLNIIPEDNNAFDITLERFEGMLVNLSKDIDPLTKGNQTMRVSKTISYNFNSYRNNMVFAYARPNIHPNQNNVPGSTNSKKQIDENDMRRLIIESNNKAPDGEIPYYPSFVENPSENYIRIDDGVVDMQGVIGFSYGDFNLSVTNIVSKTNFTHYDDRSVAPKLNTTVADRYFPLKIGTQNVLNLFNSPFDGDSNRHGESRGANTEQEFTHQKEKIVAAIIGMNADIVGLMEIENNGFGKNSAIQDLIDAINKQYEEVNTDSANRYVFIGYDENNDLILDSSDSIGSDVITTGLLYRPSKVSIKSMKVIPMPEQHAPVVVNQNYQPMLKNAKGDLLESGDNYQRNTLTATFNINNTGKEITIAVNHFKSKGSTCWEEWANTDFEDETLWKKSPDDIDKQGSCENFRVAAAVQVGEELNKIGGDRIILGDLNSYAQEDALLVLTKNPSNKRIRTARDTFIDKKEQFNISGEPITITQTYGYINAVTLIDNKHDKSSWSYSYNDEIGTLDHILLSPKLNDRLIDATDWHINAAESPLYDYNEEKKGDHADDFYLNNQFRSSDHDSAIISLRYQYNEIGETNAIYIVTNNNMAEIPFHLYQAQKTMSFPTKIGDVAQVTLSNKDINNEIITTVILTENDQSLVDFKIKNLQEGTYQAMMTLTRDNKILKYYTQTFNINVKQQDSLDAKVAPRTQDEETGGGTQDEETGGGGSFGVFTLLALFTGAFTRKKYKLTRT